MYKKTLTIILSLTFLVLLLTPTMTLLFDRKVHVVLMDDTSAETENGPENINEIDLSFQDLSNRSTENYHLAKQKSLFHLYTSYSKPYLSLIFPPPRLKTT
ncbi:hypothetical protein [Gaetbulibacter aestuarii]|uniref:Uncharacterized protein n=1 Tax=Gaetbulibacter aestuarii TaxID=1502358 RepID=A0ABW7MVC2_9FLAO